MMNRAEPVSNIMTLDVPTVSIDQRPSSVRRRLVAEGLHHLPVLRDGKLAGLISSSDMFKLAMASFAADSDALDAFLDEHFALEDIMRTDLATVRQDAPIRAAAQELAHGRFHSLPVLDEDGRFCGVISSTNLIAYLLAQY